MKVNEEEVLIITVKEVLAIRTAVTEEVVARIPMIVEAEAFTVAVVVVVDPFTAVAEEAMTVVGAVMAVTVLPEMTKIIRAIT